MRVVAGSAKGRRLQAPEGTSVRPTGDRVREAVFDMLASLDVVQGRSVADLFAGTGAMGIEALSRGAAMATFVDDEATVLDIVRTNLVITGLYARATVVQADVLDWVATAPRVDVALVDPPYSFDGWPALLDGLSAGTAVLESDRELDLGERWETLKVKRYSGTVVTLAQPASRPAAGDPADRGTADTHIADAGSADPESSDLDTAEMDTADPADPDTHPDPEEKGRT